MTRTFKTVNSRVIIVYMCGMQTSHEDFLEKMNNTIVNLGVVLLHAKVTLQVNTFTLD